MLRRLYPVAVTWTGGIGLGLALTYFVGVALAFLPGWEEWAEFFVSRAIWLLLPPYGLLILHMVLRNHVGRYLLNQGAYEEALEYGGRRMTPSLVRSRREAANQRVICAKGHIGLGEYDRASEILAGQHRKLPHPYSVEARRWLFELALRNDDRDRAEELVVGGRKKTKRARGEAVALLGCEAELALREGDLERYRERMKDGIWRNGKHPRLVLCRVLAMVQFEAEDEDSEEVLALLRLVEEPVGRDMPTRRGELKALRAMVVERRGRPEEARRLLEEARKEPVDEWSKKVIEEVAGELG